MRWAGLDIHEGPGFGGEYPYVFLNSLTIHFNTFDHLSMHLLVTITSI